MTRKRSAASALPPKKAIVPSSRSASSNWKDCGIICRRSCESLAKESNSLLFGRRVDPHRPLIDPRSQDADLLVRQVWRLGGHPLALVDAQHVMDQCAVGAVADFDHVGIERCCFHIDSIHPLCLVGAVATDA